MTSAVNGARDAFVERYGAAPDLVVRAPGRVNLIGEHTDYNDGFVLPMALPFDTAIALRSRTDDRIEVTSVGFGSASFAIGADPAGTDTWARYVHGMAVALATGGHQTAGWDGVIDTTIPAGASLSSSAALEIAAGLACVHAAGSNIDMTELAHLGKWVENEVMGLPSGILDQLASATGARGMASLIDCRDLSLRHVALPAGVAIVVMDTGTRRELVESEYANRQATCAAAARTLGVDALRDATTADLERLDGLERRRARHVIAENQRTLDAADAMSTGDVALLGQLMNDSHDSLRDDYEVSGPALDTIVEVARTIAGCHGARMTGGGFAGCAIALVDATAAAAFCTDVAARFEAPADQPAIAPTRLYVVEPSDGAGLAS